MPFGAGEIVPVRGINHRIVERPHQRGTAWIEAAPNPQSDKSLPMLCVTGERAHVARRVQDFLMREARRDIEAAVARHAGKLGVSAAQDHSARHDEPLGFVLIDRRAQFLLAADHGAELCARLSRRA